MTGICSKVVFNDSLIFHLKSFGVFVWLVGLVWFFETGSHYVAQVVLNL
jgi:hypothetical protein